MSKVSFLASSGLCAIVLACSAPFLAVAETDLESQVQALIKRVDEQQKILTTQSEEISKQKKIIDSLSVKKAKDAPSSEQTATATSTDKKSKKKGSSAKETTASASGTTATIAPVQTLASERHVEMPASMTPPRARKEEKDVRPQVDALANQGGVLSRAGTLTYENTLEYTNTTRNLFAFNGVQLAQVVLVGGIEANTTRHQIVQETGRLRLGLTNRLEADVHVPFVYRNDALTNSVTSGSSTTTTIEGANIGDVDVGLAYQINDGKAGWPFLIGNLRYKANNADGPFDVKYDSDNMAKRLPTGTGFQTVEASMTAIKVSDPAVLFGNLGYVYDVPRDVDRDFSTVHVGHVNPGDAINAMAGMGFAINQDMSFSMGYKHSYVFPTYQKTTQEGVTTTTSSGTSQVGALTFGLSYAVTPETNVNFNVEAGVTNDAPDVHLIFRVPIKLGTLF